MIFSLFGLAAGIGMPMQTSINTQLGKRLGSPLVSAMINFMVGICALFIITLIAERGLAIPFGKIFAAPPWVLFGGMFAVVFVTGNILMMPRLGSVQTVILPALGQIIMGTLIDTFGWFESAQRDMNALRVLGVVMVFGGVLLVILTKAGHLGNSAKPLPGKAGEAPAESGKAGDNSAAGTSGKKPAAGTAGKKGRLIWLWRLFGVLVGFCMASQTAVNTHLAVVAESRLYASLINFSVGLSLLIILNLLLIRTKKPGDRSGRAPLWIWSGGLFGVLYVVGNIITGLTVGTGMAVVVLLIGLMAGGLLVDQFGMFRSARRPVSGKEILGVVIMVAGGMLFHLA